MVDFDLGHDQKLCRAAWILVSGKVEDRQMDWDMLAAVAQLVAALGVIVSLAYLSIQVRRENRALAVEAKLIRQSF